MTGLREAELAKNVLTSADIESTIEGDDCRGLRPNRCPVCGYQSVQSMLSWPRPCEVELVFPSSRD